MVSATMGKAKLCGLDVKIIDHLSSDGSLYNNEKLLIATLDVLNNKYK